MIFKKKQIPVVSRGGGEPSSHLKDIIHVYGNKDQSKEGSREGEAQSEEEVV